MTNRECYEYIAKYGVRALYVKGVEDLCSELNNLIYNDMNVTLERLARISNKLLEDEDAKRIL